MSLLTGHEERRVPYALVSTSTFNYKSPSHFKSPKSLSTDFNIITVVDRTSSLNFESHEKYFYKYLSFMKEM